MAFTSLLSLRSPVMDDILRRALQPSDATPEATPLCLPPRSALQDASAKCSRCGCRIAAHVDAIEAHLDVCGLGAASSEAASEPALGRHQPLVVGQEPASCSRELAQAQPCVPAPLWPACAMPPAEMEARLLLLQRELEFLKDRPPVQVLVNNSATVNSQLTNATAPSRPRAVREPDRWSGALASPANRVVLSAIVLLSANFAQGYMDHRYRVAELQRQIDGNLLLQLAHFFKGQHA